MSIRVVHPLIALIAVNLAMGLQPANAGQKNPDVGRPGAIVGQAMNPARTPVPFGRVRLRSLDTGAIVEKASANHQGEFSFLISRPGAYVVEHIDDGDRVLASSEVLTVGAGQTVGALILLPSLAPSGAGLFGNSAAAILSAAAGAGIAAVAPTGQPISPER